MARLIFSNRLDAAVTPILVVMVSLVLIESAPVDLDLERPQSGSRYRITFRTDTPGRGARMNRFRKAARIFAAVLLEIFGESAYSRFLRIRQIASSADAYAAFCRERDADYQRRTRCC